MAARRPLTLVSGAVQELPSGDTTLGGGTVVLATSTPTITGTTNAVATAGTGMVVNASADTSLVDLTVAAAQVAAGDVLVFEAAWDLRNNSGSTVVYVFKLKLGATTVFFNGNFSYTTSTDRFEGQCRAVINLASLSDQRCKIEYRGGSVGPSNMGFDSLAFQIQGVGTAAENLSTDKTLSLTVNMTTATSQTDARLIAASLTRLR